LCKDFLVPSIFRCNAKKKNSTEQVLDSFIVALHFLWPILQDSEKVQVQNCGLNITKSAAALLLLLLLPHTFHCQIFLLAAAA
jgi:hypothetical protein